jgi:LacI family transcriptional regulator
LSSSYGGDRETASSLARARPTMRDVAALAGVSLKTASRVINGETTVAADLAAKVRRAAGVLDYRPNLAARSLRRSDGRTRTIGLLLKNVANPFSSALQRAVEDVASERGMAVFAGSVDEDPDKERRLALALVERRADGLLIVPSGNDQSYLANEQRAGLGLVFMDRPPRLLLADAVVSDNEGGARTAVQHLIAHGHTKIGFLADLREISTAAERFAGYAATLREAGIPYREELVRFDLHDVAVADQAARALLAEQRPTALFATQNLVTIGALRALRDLELNHDVALVGFDDIPLSDLLVPGVTVVAQDPALMGATACRTLFARMDGDTSPPRVHVLPTTLVPRGSGEIEAPKRHRGAAGSPVLSRSPSAPPGSVRY